MAVSVRYIVDDVDAAIEFYRDRLGFDVDMHPAPGFARLSRDGLICCSTHRVPVVPGGPEANRSPAGGIDSSSRSMTCKRQSMISSRRV